MNNSLTNKISHAILGLGLIGMLGCNPIKEGDIIAKRYEPERTYLYMMPIPHTQTIGKMTTTTFTYIPVWMRDDEDWVITIQNYNKRHKLKQREIYVPANRYDTLKVGQYFCIDSNCLTSKEDTKVRNATKDEAKTLVNTISKDNKGF